MWLKLFLHHLADLDSFDTETKTLKMQHQHSVVWELVFDVWEHEVQWSLAGGLGSQTKSISPNLTPAHE